jgi:hypothetical protein
MIEKAGMKLIGTFRDVAAAFSVSEEVDRLYGDSATHIVLGMPSWHDAATLYVVENRHHADEAYSYAMRLHQAHRSARAAETMERIIAVERATCRERAAQL